jgi:hypothetical protein
MISLIVGLILVGVLLYVVETLLPIDATIKRLIQVVVVLGCVLWIARAFGVL